MLVGRRCSNMPLHQLIYTSGATRELKDIELARLLLPQAAHATYWGFVVVVTVAAFSLTTLPFDANAIRYLLPVFYAVAATVPVIGLRGPATRLLVSGAVAFVALSGLVLFRDSTAAGTPVAQKQASHLIAAIEAQGVQHGYAGYWQGNLLTWQSDGRVQSRAVQYAPRCHADEPGWFCPFTIFSISSWYAPQPGPSFLIRDPGSAAPPVAPLRELQVDGFVVDVYASDIGALAAQHTALWPESAC